MTAAAPTAAPRLAPATAPRGPIAGLALVASRELRDALGSRWFLLYTASFVVLAVALSFVSLAGTGTYGYAGFGRTAAGLLNLIMLIVPLMGLTMGAGAIAGERERGTLVYLLAQPISRAELLLGKFTGLSLALVASLALGFGTSALLLAWRAGGAGAAAFGAMVAYTAILGLAMLAVGLLLSALARKSGVAVGMAIFLWLTLVFLSDLGLMAGTLVFKLRVEELFALAVANPLQAFKMAVMRHLHTSLDVLGPAGLYAAQTYGASLFWILGGILLAWVGAPLALALVVFARRSPL
jgi:Cu-processing system permease protein